ncbi:hypothetical protein AMATHDRAFT_141905 [Amanita thiersii Skay4041]|uniref:Uncharacterized protein n=1 Tax=Amanita thiersii Skay4041 TaxID=703135 RepID=A0A2A9NQW6_9AGAR|nr:hypothetical protein AMATHDRAFT_141905 [Amanita thiersii Skay4041]
MPPPTVGDPWLAGRRFGVVIDAGSSGSRLQIYSWKDPRSIRIEKGSELAYSLPKVEKGTQHGEEWVKKVEPGISSFADNPEGVAGHLAPLLSHAMQQVPPSLQPQTPLFLLATAGMRLLTPGKQAEVLEQACQFLKLHSHFKIDEPSEKGPCGTSVRIITGEEEGLFGWIAVNYLTDGFTGYNQGGTTYGFLDMGGASTQIAFEPSPEHQGDAKNLINVRLRLLGGNEIQHSVFVTTWLGYGTNQARERYVGKAIVNHEAARKEGRVPDEDIVLDPCLPKGLELTERPVHSTITGLHVSKVHTLVGTGSFEQCMHETVKLLNKDAPCPDTPCLMNGVYVPPINFSVSHFIGISEYWYSSEHIFGLGGAYDVVQYERAASEFCSRDWQGLLKQHEELSAQHRLGGDGEVLKDGKVVGAGKWNPKIELSRLEMQCFKAAWVVNVLHEGIGLPRIVDPGGNVSHGADEVIEAAEKKGLGRPRFQSLDSVGDIAISWTLGKMVLEASKEVPAPSRGYRPIVDPIDDIPNIENAPFQPIRPPFLSIQGLEERISPHLPYSLTRSSLGFSPVLLFFYLSVVCLAIIAYPVRRQLRVLFLRSVRSVTSRCDEQDLRIEEGNRQFGSRPPSPTSAGGKFWPSAFRGLFMSSRPKPVPHPLNLNNIDYSSQTGAQEPRVRTPTRSSTMPTVGASSTQYSRSPSPMPGYINDENGFGPLLSSRSRNGSHMNLSNLAPRSAALSRANSMMHVTDKPPHQDE